MYTVLHGFIYEIRIRRGLCEGCRKDSQSLHIEDLVGIISQKNAFILFYFIPLTRSFLEYSFGNTLLAFAVLNSNLGTIAMALMPSDHPNLT